MLFAGTSFGRGVVPLGSFGAASKKSAAVQALQQAIRTLGQATTDKAFAITADGVIGPRTVAAVNRAFKTQVNSVRFNEVSGVSGMTSAQVVANASALTSAINDFLRAKGITKTGSTVGTKISTSSSPVKAPTKTAPTRMSKSASVQRLQQAVRILGQQKGDKALVIVADGLIGPRTVAAANRALSKYASEAPPEYRTGSLTAAQIGTMADNLVPYLHQTADVKVPAKATPLTPMPHNAPKGKAAVAALQQALQTLGEGVGDAAIQSITADGLVGPKTTGAVNKAFTQYIASAYAPAQFRTGRLTNATVSANAAKLADLVNREAVRRAGGAPADEGGAPAEPGAQPGQVVAQQQLPAAAAQAAAAAQGDMPSSPSTAAATYQPPGTFTPASGGGGGSIETQASSSEEAADDGSGAMVQTTVTTSSWAALSTPMKVAVGGGAAVGGTLLIWGIVKLFSGRHGARGAVRAAARR